ncbi:hypothetical protein C0989_001554 [Termitomyces sp. Mn162]|nr:hypothetical protein C0989_001554 [Termitomyces sp. Mn162]
MDKDPSSLERPPVEVTYLERQKKKRKITETTDDPSHSDSTSASVPPTTSSRKVIKTMKPVSVTAPESKESLKTDNHPTSKRVRRDSDESVKTAVSKRNQHVWTTSSISVSHLPPQAPTPTSASATSKKPISVASVKRPGSRRTTSPDTDVDDSASIADSIMCVGRIRRNEAQRLEYFKNEPLCGALTKDSAECKRCGKSVRLGGRTTYRIRPWEMHRVKCDQMPAPVDDDPDDDAQKSKQRAKTVEQRIAILTADSAISSLKPHEVLCRNCGTWVRLSSNVPYKITNWKAHTLTCQSLTKHQPSDRVAAATRKLRLVNDSQVKSFTECEVVCVYCGSTVISNNENGEGKYQGEYSLLAWTEHKVTCTHNLPKIEKADISTIPFPGRPPHSTASLASTEATLIVSEPKQTTKTQGSKRAREDEGSASGELDDTMSRPANRARTETREKPSKEPTTATGWLALPFQAFIRGFKENLSRS